MGQYLILKDVVTGSDVFALSRNSDITQAIIENYGVPFNDYKRFDNVDLAIEELNDTIFNTEERINAMLIKRDFDVFEYTEAKEYLRELYDTRGALRLINTILYDNKNIQMNYS
jgi:hypothetical protein